MRLAALSALALLALLTPLAGCAPEPAEVQEPLQPLVYTETNAQDPGTRRAREEVMLQSYLKDGSLPGEEELLLVGPQDTPTEEIGDNILGELLTEEEAERVGEEGQEKPKVDEAHPGLDLSSPEALARVVFDALMRQDEELFRRTLIDEQGLMDLAKVKPETARQRLEKLHQSAMDAYALFSPQNPSEEPVGGLASKVRYESFKLGTPGTIWGKKPRRNEETVQHWSNTVYFSLTSQPLEPEADGKKKPEPPFSLSLGRILRVPSGEWRLAAAPDPSGIFRAYLRAGFHFKPEMLQPEHHPFPLSVGNFWLYRVKRPESGGLQELEALDATSEEVRLEVIDVEALEGYRLVTLRRIHKHLETKTETLRYLVTPRRLYFCSRYCAGRIKEVPYVIDYTRFNTPHLIFPLKPGVAWGAGGTSSRRDDTHVRQDTAVVTVPAGEFRDALVVDRTFKDKGEVRYFKPGVGVVRREGRDERGPYTEEMIKYRILTTE